MEAPEAQVKEQWIKEQNELCMKLVMVDALNFELETEEEKCKLKLIAGVDISFIKDDAVNACACLVVLSYPELEIVYEATELVELTQPYIPSFLAFREVPHLVPLLDKLKDEHPEFFPQIIVIDGNGYLHPRGFGLACHLGVLCDIPTIGIGKTFYHVDGLDMRTIKTLFNQTCTKGGDWMEVKGKSGTVWGAALKSNKETTSPIYVSIGHRISLETAVTIVKLLCKYRVPEPVRQADLQSRAFLRQYLK